MLLKITLALHFAVSTLVGHSTLERGHWYGLDTWTLVYTKISLNLSKFYPILALGIWTHIHANKGFLQSVYPNLLFLSL